MTENSDTMSAPTCTILGCGRKLASAGLCSAHYRRKRTGKPLDDPFRAVFTKAQTFAERFWAKVDIRGEDECWPWKASVNASGYGRYKRGDRPESAHRVAWELTNGPIPDGLWVLHRCDNPPCCNPGHHFLGTCADNNADRDAKGRARPPRGEDNGCSKLTEAQVVEIRLRLLRRHRGKDIASEFGVSPGLITQIKQRVIWAHV